MRQVSSPYLEKIEKVIKKIIKEKQKKIKENKRKNKTKIQKKEQHELIKKKLLKTVRKITLLSNIF